MHGPTGARPATPPLARPCSALLLRAARAPALQARAGSSSVSRKVGVRLPLSGQSARATPDFSKMSDAFNKQLAHPILCRSDTFGRFNTKGALGLSGRATGAGRKRPQPEPNPRPPPWAPLQPTKPLPAVARCCQPIDAQAEIVARSLAVGHNQTVTAIKRGRSRKRMNCCPDPNARPKPTAASSGAAA